MAFTSPGSPRLLGLLPRRRSEQADSLTGSLEIPDKAVPDGWFLFRDLEVDGRAVGLVLVGVRGVYAIDSHRVDGKLDVSKSGLRMGSRGAHVSLDGLRARAHLLAEALGAPVAPLVVVDADGHSLSWVGDVPVVDVAELRSFLINSTARRIAWDEFKRIRDQLDQRIA